MFYHGQLILVIRVKAVLVLPRPYAAEFTYKQNKLQGRIKKPELLSNMREMGTIFDTKVTDYVLPDWNCGINNRDVCERGQNGSCKQIERLHIGRRVSNV